MFTDKGHENHSNDKNPKSKSMSKSQTTLGYNMKHVYF